MDTKRLIIALSLSLVVLFGWSYLFPPAEPVTAPAPAAQSDSKTAAGASAAVSAAEAVQAVAPASQARKISVKTPLFSARFSSQGGVLERFDLLKFRQTIDPKSPPIDMVGDKARDRSALGVILKPAGQEIHTWNSPNWTSDGQDMELKAGEKKTLTFTGEAGGMRLERRLTVSADSYLITEELLVTNPGQDAIAGHVAFTAASEGLSPSEDDKYNPTRIAYGSVKTGFEEVTSVDDMEKQGVDSKGAVNWGAIESNYFLFAILPGQGESQLNGLLKSGVYNLAVSQPASIAAGQTQSFKCSYYMGPADRDILADMPNKLAEAVDFGWFHLIAVPLLKLLNWFYKYVHNYGVAIILLTVLIKIIFWPLSQKSYKSMDQMKKLQPMLTKLREKYADDKERMNQEVMQLYKTYKVNPAGGCLPMVVQIPVFFGLYKALLGSIELRHAAFISHVPFTDLVWMADLSVKDPYYVTPLIMGATMFIQQKMTPTGGDPTQAKIMLLMPVVFTFMFLNFPAGLVVYWLVNNVLSIAQQWWMMRKA
ncbi:MAG: membrane protein insertase YidC [Humidesulfovibrio sp.]|uniref:membrane protein insertase YidC n=1 Tax=Humidesulfovibrio sp. TaxID=2910988 RepID=UPI0027E61067|nr:membrane protein insertase YidC [Humidesulfovibrio sp.]MDQ7834571.1 membrane protein insertase YidC [Humidesulfovibrio sp.]